RLTRRVQVEGVCTRCVRPLPPWGLNGAEEAMLLVVQAGGEEQGVRGPALMVVAKGQRPQVGDRDRDAVVVRERAEEGAARWVVGVDAAIAAVADQQRSAERTEIRRRQGEPPRRVERTPGGETP